MAKLAIDGGEPLFPTPLELPVYNPFGQEERDAVMRVLDTGTNCRLGGDEATAFEREFAAHYGRKHALAVNSGTSALHCAVIASRVGPGDEVITSPFTYVSSSTAVLCQNAIPVFADVDPRTFNITAETIEPKITPRTRAIIAVHLFGQMCDMDPIVALAEKHGLFLIEDGCQAHGATYTGKRAGTLGEMGVFSLQQSKQMTTGDGGMVITDDDDLYERAVRGHLCGWMFDDPYNHYCLGFKYRFTDIEAALGRAQLKRLAGFLDVRRDNAAAFAARLDGVPFIEPAYVIPGAVSSYWLYPLKLSAEFPRTRDWFVEAVTAEGVPRGSVNPGYIPRPNYLEKLYTEKRAFAKGCPWSCPFYEGKVEYAKGDCPQLEDAMERLVTVPVAPPRDTDFMEKLGNAVEKVVTAL